MAKSLLLLLVILATGCNLNINVDLPFDTVTPEPATTTPPLVITVIVPATPMPVRPTATPVRVQPTTGATIRVKLFFIALEDNGRSGKRIGCGDSVVFRERDIPRTESPLRDTLTLLFSAKQQYYGTSRLYNALYLSELRVNGISSRNGVFRVDLSGRVGLGGLCDGPRFEAQIKETILQFPTVRQVNVFINGVALERVVSGA
jgi:hypothetical protein